MNGCSCGDRQPAAALPAGEVALMRVPGPILVNSASLRTNGKTQQGGLTACIPSRGNIRTEGGLTRAELTPRVCYRSEKMHASLVEIKGVLILVLPISPATVPKTY